MKLIADAVLDASLLVTRLVRAEARRSHPAGLSLSEFRALACLDAYRDSTLTELAEYLGVQLPTASKLADGLVRRGEITRREDAEDRRRNRLALTPAGQARLALAMGVVREHLGQRLAGLAAADQEVILRAMQLLEPLVAPGASATSSPHAAVDSAVHAPQLSPRNA